MPAPDAHGRLDHYHPLSDGSFHATGASIFPAVSAEQWEPLKEYLNSDGTIPLNFGAFLIREEDDWTLVDTGFGKSPGELRRPAAGTIAEGQAQPADIARVIFTHLHPTTSAGPRLTGTAGP